MNLTDFDTSKFKLGALCKRGHDYEGTGRSLRYLSKSMCTECNKMAGKNRRERNAEYCREYAKEYYEKNKEHLMEYAREYGKKWREENYERMKATRTKEWHETRGEYLKAYKVANPEKARHHNRKRLTMIKRQSDGSVTTHQIRELIADAIKCPYCFKKMAHEEKVIDHMIPLSKKGLHSIDNLAICCADCNKRKFNKSYSDWLDCLEPKQRKSAERLYYKRYGVSPIQGVLPLVFETKDKSDA